VGAGARSARLDDVVEQVIRTLEFSVLAKWAFSVAQSFSGFYHAAPILKEERDDVGAGAPPPSSTCARSSREPSI
jgi:arginyl-tRNA synthetase